MNRVINMSGRSLKCRIDECDQHTTQINMLITEALRGAMTRRESSCTSFSPSIPNRIYFYFMLHEKWMGNYLLFLMSFLFEGSSSTCCFLESDTNVLRSQSLVQSIHTRPHQPERQNQHLQAWEKWRSYLLLEIQNEIAWSQPAGQSKTQLFPIP